MPSSRLSIAPRTAAVPHITLVRVTPSTDTDQVRCYFCFAEGEVPRLSKEHLLSQPVAAAFGVDRSAHIGQIDPASGTVQMARLDDAAVRFVCARCNNTWMNDLEHDFANLAFWVGSSELALSSSQLQALQAWSLKTYLVLSVMVGNARQFVEDPTSPGVIPSFTRARQLYEKDAAAYEGMAFGLARPYRSVGFSYAFGNPRVTPQGPRSASRKSAGVAIIALGAIQLWIVDPTIFHSADVRFPSRVVRARPGLTYGALRGMPPIPSLEEVVVDNGQHDIVELMGRVESWAREQSGLIGDRPGSPRTGLITPPG